MPGIEKGIQHAEHLFFHQAMTLPYFHSCASYEDTHPAHPSSDLFTTTRPSQLFAGVIFFKMAEITSKADHEPEGGKNPQKETW